VLPRGARGEIAVKGPTLMLGYVGVPRDETLDEDGFFHTGDGGYLDAAGRLFWEGRLTDVIKTGGANVSPLEIDELLAAHPGVKRVQTVGVPHETLGEMVVSCVVLHDGTVLEETAIRDYARQRLASYKVPRRVLFLCEDELTMTGSDKVKTGALRQLAVERLGAAVRS
jgi:fatty-acyl-CoA synthase